MKKPELCLTVLAVFLPVLAPAAAYAGAWAQPQGQGQVINTFSYYEVNVQGFNALGRPSGQGEYTQLEYSPYVEYGLTNRWTVGLQPRFQYVTQSGLPGTGRTLGLVQMNLLARYQVYRDDLNALSIQGQVGIPGAATGISPELAQPNAEYEGRVLYGRNFSLPHGWPAFLDVEAGYRLETDGNANQVRGDGTLGFVPSSRWTILAQSFNTISVSQALPGDFNYNLNRVEISAVYGLTKKASIQFGAWRDVAGKNISLGTAGIVALWYQF